MWWHDRLPTKGDWLELRVPFLWLPETFPRIMLRCFTHFIRRCFATQPMVSAWSKGSRPRVFRDRKPPWWCSSYLKSVHLWGVWFSCFLSHFCLTLSRLNSGIRYYSREISACGLAEEKKKKVHAASIRKNVVFEALGNRHNSVQSILYWVNPLGPSMRYVCVCESCGELR